MPNNEEELNTEIEIKNILLSKLTNMYHLQIHLSFSPSNISLKYVWFLNVSSFLERYHSIADEAATTTQEKAITNANERETR